MGQIVATAVVFYFKINLPIFYKISIDFRFMDYVPYVSFGPIFFGGLTGLLIALWRYRLVPMPATLSYSAITAPFTLGIPIAAYLVIKWYLVGTTPNDDLARLGRNIAAFGPSTLFTLGSYITTWTITSFIAVGLVGLALVRRRPQGFTLFLLPLLATIAAGASIVIGLALGALDDFLCSSTSAHVLRWSGRSFSASSQRSRRSLTYRRNGVLAGLRSGCGSQRRLFSSLQ